MICSKEIVLSGEEVEFLTKGPEFMLRPELDRMEFGIELEKMVAKQAYRNGEHEKNETPDVELEEKINQISTESRLMYNKRTRCLDMGNLRASDYKFNRFIHLPRPENAETEALHKTRRKEMTLGRTTNHRKKLT